MDSPTSGNLTMNQSETSFYTHARLKNQYLLLEMVCVLYFTFCVWGTLSGVLEAVFEELQGRRLGIRFWALDSNYWLRPGGEITN